MAPLLAEKFELMKNTQSMSAQTNFCDESNKFISIKQGWVIRRRRIIRRIVFITYLTVFFKLLRIIRFWALNEFCSHKPPRAPQKHSQAL